ncbi:hypothetical protein CP356_06685 [Lactobacillus sp. UMNPBX5]|nr:hypothetical protein CP356_06685 [Lactobacillus sp. UMNPBX5]
MAMNVYMNKYQEDYDDKGQITGAELGMYGNDKDGEYISANLIIKADELGKKDDGTAKSFDDVSVTEVKNLAKQKLISYLIPTDNKATTNTDNTTNS